MEFITRWIEDSLGIGIVVQQRLFSTVIVIAVLVLLRWVVVRLVARRTDNPDTIYSWRKGVQYITLAIAVLVIGRIWIDGSGDIFTYLGLLSAGLAIALQDPITNVIGWLFIIVQRPFEVGDRIEVDGVAGDVIDVRYFQFSMLEIRNWVDADQSTGRILHVPNRTVFSNAIANFTGQFSYIWNEIPVLITFESDWRLAKQLLQQVAEAHVVSTRDIARNQLRLAARKYPIHYENLTPAVFTSVEGSGVKLSIRHLCEVRRRRIMVQLMWEDILDAFGQHDSIQFAYPTQRVYVPPAETVSPIHKTPPPLDME